MKNCIAQLIKESIKVHNQVQIKRDKIDSNPINCIPLILSADLLLVQNIYDFSFDGYSIIRRKDITSIRMDDSEKFSKYILEKEGIYSQIKEPNIVNLDCWESALKALWNMGKNIIIECENTEENEFYIGRITDVNKTSIRLHCFDGIGEWEPEPSKINFSKITMCSFDVKYIKIISKYTRDF